MKLLGLQILVSEHLNNAPIDQRMDDLQLLRDNEAQDCVPKPSEFIIGVPTKRPNAKKNNCH